MKVAEESQPPLVSSNKPLPIKDVITRTDLSTSLVSKNWIISGSWHSMQVPYKRLAIITSKECVKKKIPKPKMVPFICWSTKEQKNKLSGPSLDPNSLLLRFLRKSFYCVWKSGFWNYQPSTCDMKNAAPMPCRSLEHGGYSISLLENKESGHRVQQSRKVWQTVKENKEDTCHHAATSRKCNIKFSPFRKR